MDYMGRYEELLKAQHVNYMRAGSFLLREYNQIIIPLGPIKCEKPIEEIDTEQVFKILKGKLLWWSHFDGNIKNNWYGVVKYQFIDVDDYPSANTRNQVRKGLNNCEIKRISVADLTHSGFDIYKSALSQFTKEIAVTQDEFNRQIGITAEFQDIIHYRGVFYQNVLIGYAVIYTYGNLEANISEIRIMPEYNRYYPSYALFHELSRYYLHELKFEYMSDGYRNLMHQTNIQELLIQKFGFEKMGLSLHLYLRKPYGLIMNVLYLFKTLIRVRSIAAVLKLMTIYKKENGAIN